MVVMTSFADLGLPVGIANQLRKQGISVPFPIQAAAIPDVLAGHDILGRAPTGSGKTFAFGLPMIARLSSSGASKPGRPRGVILTPTRELAAQISERLRTVAQPIGLRVLEIVGGVSIGNQIRQLAAPVDILVVTPGRALELIELKHLDLSQAHMVVLDEADLMADLGFLPQVVKLLKKTPRAGQRLFFSATLDGDVKQLVAKFMKNPITHATAEVTAAVDTMKHYCFQVDNKRNRNQVVAQIANRKGKTIMFMRTKYGVDRQVHKLRQVGVNAAGLHGDKSQIIRTAVISAFSQEKIPVLVATDIAARGIDISAIDVVVHIDPPADYKAYLHRAGRTARAGATGKVITLVLADQTDEVNQLLHKAGVTAETYNVTPESPELIELTQAAPPSGQALGELHLQLPEVQHSHRRGSRGKQSGASVGRGRGHRRKANKKSSWGGSPEVSIHSTKRSGSRKVRGR